MISVRCWFVVTVVFVFAAGGFEALHVSCDFGFAFGCVCGCLWLICGWCDCYVGVVLVCVARLVWVVFAVLVVNLVVFLRLRVVSLLGWWTY